MDVGREISEHAWAMCMGVGWGTVQCLARGIGVSDRQAFRVLYRDRDPAELRSLILAARPRLAQRRLELRYAAPVMPRTMAGSLAARAIRRRADCP